MTFLRRYAIAIALLIPFLTSGQQFGLVIREDHYDQQPTLRTADGSKSTLEKLEDVQLFSLKEHCPTPLNQGANASCVGWAVGYAAQTIYKARQLGIKGREAVDEIALSPHFIFNQIKLKDCALGAEIPDALRFLMTTGNVPNSHFADGASDCFYQPSSEQFLQAHENRIPDFRKLFGPEDLRTEKINSVKLALLEGFPVVIAMNVKESFFKLTKGQKIWYSELGAQQPLGAHALVVVGFDEVENAFEVMNSWGTDWASDGFAWIRYKDFEQFVNYGFTFYLSEHDLLSVMVNFKRKSLITIDQNVQFTDELFRYADNVYTPVNSVATQYSDYKLDISHSSSDYNMACFNKGGSGNYQLLFNLDRNAFDFFGEQATYGISVPHEENASIKLTDPVSEKFVFVISREPLTAKIVQEIEQKSELADMNTALAAKFSIQGESRYSYNKVGVIADLKPNSAVILPVSFDYGVRR